MVNTQTAVAVGAVLTIGAIGYWAHTQTRTLQQTLPAVKTFRYLPPAPKPEPGFCSVSEALSLTLRITGTTPQGVVTGCSITASSFSTFHSPLNRNNIQFFVTDANGRSLRVHNRTGAADVEIAVVNPGVAGDSKVKLRVPFSRICFPRKCYDGQFKHDDEALPNCGGTEDSQEFCPAGSEIGPVIKTETSAQFNCRWGTQSPITSEAFPLGRIDLRSDVPLQWQAYTSPWVTSAQPCDDHSYYSPPPKLSKPADICRCRHYVEPSLLYRYQGLTPQGFHIGCDVTMAICPPANVTYVRDFFISTLRLDDRKTLKRDHTAIFMVDDSLRWDDEAKCVRRRQDGAVAANWPIVSYDLNDFAHVKINFDDVCFPSECGLFGCGTLVGPVTSKIDKSLFFISDFTMGSRPVRISRAYECGQNATSSEAQISLSSILQQRSVPQQYRIRILNSKD